MSYIAAVGAKNKANAFLNNSYNPTDTVSTAMSANAAKDIAETKNEAQRDYFGRIGEAEIDSIAKVGAARNSAADKAFMGEMFATIGQGAMGVSKFGQGAGWFDKGTGSTVWGQNGVGQGVLDAPVSTGDNATKLLESFLDFKK